MSQLKCPNCGRISEAWEGRFDDNKQAVRYCDCGNCFPDDPARFDPLADAAIAEKVVQDRAAEDAQGFKTQVNETEDAMGESQQVVSAEIQVKI